jgi:hypothetical protein
MPSNACHRPRVHTLRPAAGGALADPVDEGLLVFKGEAGVAGAGPCLACRAVVHMLKGAFAAERFAEADPYVTSKLVSEWSKPRGDAWHMCGVSRVWSGG